MKFTFVVSTKSYGEFFEKVIEEQFLINPLQPPLNIFF